MLTVPTFSVIARPVRRLVVATRSSNNAGHTGRYTLAFIQLQIHLTNIFFENLLRKNLWDAILFSHTNLKETEGFFYAE